MQEELGDDDNFVEEVNPNVIDPIELSFFETSHGNRGLMPNSSKQNVQSPKV